jgi:hypothetical protein
MEAFSFVQVHHFPFNLPLRLHQNHLSKHISLKGSSCSISSLLIHVVVLRYMFLILRWGLHHRWGKRLICGRTSPITIVLIAAVGTSFSSISSRSTCSLGEPLVSSNTTSLVTSTKNKDLLKTLYAFIFEL